MNCLVHFSIALFKRNSSHGRPPPGRLAVCLAGDMASARRNWRKLFDDVAGNPELARETLKSTSSAELRGENSIARFLENAFDVLVECGVPELPRTYSDLVRSFLESRNLRYELSQPFEIRPHVSGVFSALVSDVMAQMQTDHDLREAAAEFEYAFGALTHSHSEPDMKVSVRRTHLFFQRQA